MEPSSVINKIRTADDSPLEFDELVEAWNSLCEKASSEKPAEFQFADIESAAIAALSEDSEKSPSGKVGTDISRMLNSFDYPTYLVTVDGRVAAANNAAAIEFDLDIGNPIDHLPYTFDEAVPLSALIRDNMNVENDVEADAILKRAYAADNEKNATIALTSSFGRVPMALVFVVTTKWKPKSSELLQRQFGLTDAESEVLISFINGYSSQDIAKQRDRSHATIRTQFQSIMIKTGTHNQTELLRTVLSISDFSKSINKIVDAANHPHRRVAYVVREKGRRIELTLMGNLEGTPILTIAGPSVYTCNADIEQALYDKGLYVISVCTPGCGKTDPVAAGNDRMKTIEDDVSSILDQLKIDSCVILALTNNTPICQALSVRLPDRFTHVVQMSACVPIKYSRAISSQSQWLTGILRASEEFPAMKNVLLKGAIKAWATVGARQFIRFQLASNPIDSAHAFLHKNIVENEHALKTATANGISAVVEDIALSFEDWTDDVNASSIGTTIIHGEQDQLFPIGSVRSFASDFPHKVELIEIPESGFTFIQQDPGQAIGILKEIVSHHG